MGYLTRRAASCVPFPYLITSATPFRRASPQPRHAYDRGPVKRRKNPASYSRVRSYVFPGTRESTALSGAAYSIQRTWTLLSGHSTLAQPLRDPCLTATRFWRDCVAIPHVWTSPSAINGHRIFA